jgi:hypothetical protein
VRELSSLLRLVSVVTESQTAIDVMNSASLNWSVAKGEEERG